jgi:hypothetical protein
MTTKCPRCGETHESVWCNEVNAGPSPEALAVVKRMNDMADDAHGRLRGQSSCDVDDAARARRGQR